MSANPSTETPSQEQPLVAHLIELRDRVLRMVLVVLAILSTVFAQSLQ
ncbi:MAG: hypothetical protein KZQ77_14485 [Candidatus Thiodiazotropha sp. (ex Notomyrtea botanica)]|nr:hypothetical protein [Candidatus Thiodiazotropha sp. (ex Notomyrtea botanica)]